MCVFPLVRAFSASTRWSGLFYVVLENGLSCVRLHLRRRHRECLELNACAVNAHHRRVHVERHREASRVVDLRNEAADIEAVAPDTRRRILVLCSDGKRSLLAAATLRAMGYPFTYVIAGGWAGAACEVSLHRRAAIAASPDVARPDYANVVAELQRPTAVVDQEKKPTHRTFLRADMVCSSSLQRMG